MLDVRECIEKNSSLILAKSKVSYSEGQSSPLELGFGVELGLNSHSKNLRVLTNISTSFTFTIERAATWGMKGLEVTLKRPKVPLVAFGGIW